MNNASLGVYDSIKFKGRTNNGLYWYVTLPGKDEDSLELGKNFVQATKRAVDASYDGGDYTSMLSGSSLYVLAGSPVNNTQYMRKVDDFDMSSYIDHLVNQWGISFKTGGLADFTGPAWLDGTPSKPEYILNSAQTERFFALIDVLESFNKNDSTPTKSGDNYFDINI
jgi:hypothetical protein